MHDNIKPPKDMKAQCLLPIVEMFTADGDLDLEDQDYLKNLILKIKIRSPKQCDFEDQGHAHLCICNSD